MLLVSVSMKFVMLVEDNPKEAALGFGSVPAEDQDASGILDTGFVITTWIHKFLKVNTFANDVAAAANSILVLTILIYILKVMLWNGDFGLCARIIFAQLLRGFSGCFTYLPPSKQFLPSRFDVPEVFSSGVCTGGWRHFLSEFGRKEEETVQIPFVCFFSGHVANTVVAANHLYLHGHKKAGFFLHALNVLQIVRLLATRGHYSIDIIVGWIVAVYVSNSAEKIGRWYSRVPLEELQTTMFAAPNSAEEVFEHFIRADDIRHTADYTSEAPEIPKTALKHVVEAAAEALDEAQRQVQGLASEYAPALPVRPLMKLTKARDAAAAQLEEVRKTAHSALEDALEQVQTALGDKVEAASDGLQNQRAALRQATEDAVSAISDVVKVFQNRLPQLPTPFGEASGSESSPRSSAQSPKFSPPVT